LNIPGLGILLIFISMGTANAQFKYTFTGTVTDKANDSLLAGITLTLKKDTVTLYAHTDKQGHFSFPALTGGNYILQITAIHYEEQTIRFLLDKNKNLPLKLESQFKLLNDVYVTARESRSMTSASVIDRSAMQLLQPSSFTDLLELLPGGRSRDPNLTSMNKMSLREVGTSSDQRNTSALGTGFYIDGAPVVTNANIQTTLGFTASDPNAGRNSVNKGVDMRSISTDQIEKVEIIRGIPSVEYGDITSGAVMITRKKGKMPYSARIKADGFSKLYSIGKGFANKRNDFFTNIDIDYLDAKANPTNSYSNYKRITTSLRTEKIWKTAFGSLEWMNSIDYGKNIDNERTDPDNSFALTDKYVSYFNSYNYATRLKIQLPKNSFFKSVDINGKVNYQQDKIDVKKWMQPSTATVLVNTTEPGVHDVGFLIAGYTGHMMVDGKPLNVFVKANSVANYFIGSVKNNLKIGTDFNYSKNLGKGQVYDMNFPVGISAGTKVGASTRPRAFDTIPSMQQLAAYIENTAIYRTGDHILSLEAGLRAFTMLNMDRRFTLSNKILFNPRVNAKWQLPSLLLQKKPLLITIGGGYGILSKTPTLDMLYPPQDYTDIIQLNYYHNNPAFRTANVITYIIDKTNYALGVAKNIKQELSVDLSYAGNRLTITYFNETLNSGFRSSSRFQALEYRRYNNTSINPDTLTQKPSVNAFAYTSGREYSGYSIPSNGSKQIKRGIEYQFTSKRIMGINTRFTLNGAWFKTRHADSQRSYGVISSNVVTDGKIRQYLGIYADNAGTYYEQLNTNLTVDSYLPALGINIAASFQNLWYTANQSLYKSGTPLQYVDIDGNVHEYTEADKTHPHLQALNTIYNSTAFKRYQIPVDLNINLKISKSFSKNRFVVSMFANRIATYKPNYTNENGAYIVRSGLSTPYFGMEMNINF
jgi:hypothetical protein